MTDRKAKLIASLALLMVLSAISSCHYLPIIGPRVLLREPNLRNMEMRELGPVHFWVPEWVLCIDEDCTLVDDLGSPVTNLEVIRGGKVTIWNKSGDVSYVNFGEAFSPPGSVRLNPDYGVWRRVAMEASESGFEIKVTCGESEENTFVGYALPDTIITPPPGP